MMPALAVAAIAAASAIAAAAAAAAAAVGVEDVGRFRLFSRERLFQLMPEGFAGKP